MVTPFSTPPIPLAPRGTPSSISHKSSSLKRPIYNPYDKFTQPEFDAWIDDITGTLRRALGQYDEPKRYGVLGAGLGAVWDEGEGASGESEDVNDSFAEVRTLRAKGKAKDPREGPGLGGKNEPIEIGSDSDGDEEADSGEEQQVEWREEGSEEDEDGGTENPEAPALPLGSGTKVDEPIELSDEDDAGDVEGEDVDYSGHVWNTLPNWNDESGAWDHTESSTRSREGVAEEDDLRAVVIDEVEDFPPIRSAPISQPIDLPDPWEGPKTFAEDFYSGGDFRENDIDPSRCSPSNLTPLRDTIMADHRQLGTAATNGRDLVHGYQSDDGSLPSSSPLAPSVVGEANALDEIYDALDREDAQAGVGGLPPQDHLPVAPQLVVTFDLDDDQFHLPTYTVGESQMDAGRVSSTPAFESDNYQVIEDEDEEVGAIPLGTSDLMIDENVLYAIVERYNNGGRDGEEDEDADRFEEISHTETTRDEDMPIIHDLRTKLPEDPQRIASMAEFGLNGDTMPMSSARDEDVPTSGPHEGEDEDTPEKRVKSFISETVEYSVIEVDSTYGEAHAPHDMDGDVESVADDIGERVVYAVEEPVAVGLTESILETSTDQARERMLSPPHVSEVHPTNTFTSLSGTVTDETTQSPQKPPEPGDFTMGDRADFASCDLPEGVPMPVSADPNIPDPTSRSPPPTVQVILTTPEALTSTYSPANTPGGSDYDPTVGGMTGLFTPSNGVLSVPGTPSQAGEPDEGDAQPEQESSTSHTVALEESQTQVVAGLAADVATEETPVDEAVPNGAIQMTNPDEAIDSGPSIPLPSEVSCNDVPPHSLIPALHGADPSNPVLYADPYPYSLSTPGSEFLLSTPRMSEEDLEEEGNGHSATSSPTTKNSGGTSPVPADRDTHEFGLPYPSDAEQYLLGTLTPALRDIQDHQAEGRDEGGLGQPVDVDADGNLDANVFVSNERTDLHREEPPEDVSATLMDFDGAVGAGTDMREGESVALVSVSEDVGESADNIPEEGEFNTSAGVPDIVSDEHADVCPEEQAEDISAEPIDFDAVMREIAESQKDEGGALASANEDVGEIADKFPEEDQVTNGDPSTGAPVVMLNERSEEQADDLSAKPVDDAAVKESTDPQIEGEALASASEGARESLENSSREGQPHKSQLTNGNPSVDAPTTAIGTDQDHAVEEEQRPRKRKRKASLTIKRQVSKSSPSKDGEHHKARGGRKGKGKGKEKAVEIAGKTREDPDSAGENRSISSSASSVLKMLRKPNSRASSVMSTNTDSSTATQISPSRKKPARKPNVELIPPSLFHAHGPTRQHQHRPPPSPVVQKQQEVSHPVVKDAPPAEVATPIAKSASLRSVPSSSSPVTRSNCRFHKISLPREEGGPRVCFLVPGCSLGNRELMDAQEIEDHGYATIEDSKRVITHVESLDFTSYLVGILRQLVGVDLLREQEVYYLPPPEEESGRTAKRKSALTRLSVGSADLGSTAGSPRLASGSSLSRPPFSASSTRSSTSKVMESERFSASLSPCSESGEDEGSELPSAKRHRSELFDVAKEAPQVREMAPPPPPEPSTSTAPPPAKPVVKPRRSKRLGADAAEYKPDKDEKESSDEEVDRRRKRKQSRGIKRTLTKEDGDEVDRDRKSKHRRLRPTSSASAAEQT